MPCLHPLPPDGLLSTMHRESPGPAWVETSGGVGGVGRVRVGHALVDVLSPEDAATTISDLAARGHGQLVVTPNISHIALLERRHDFRRAYDGAALVLPDGWPVARAITLLARRRQRRVNGTQLMLDLCALAARRGQSVGFVGGVADAATRCADLLVTRHPALRVVLVDPAPAEALADPLRRDAILARIAAARPDLLFLGLGAPKQELFAASNDIDAAVVIAVGSSLELIAGLRRRAPAGWRRLGLEWLHRALQEPRRLGPRYLRDAPLFVWVVARELWRRRPTTAS